MSSVLKFALAAAIGYASIVALAYLAQRKLMYFPSTMRVAPAAVGLADVEERVLRTPDGAQVVAWYGRAAPGQPTLLYFHGNGGNLALRAERIRHYLDRGRGMFMMSYRGYSGSTGSPTETDNIADARLAYLSLIADGVEAGRIILYGESLGSGVATRLAAELPVGGLILESPYTSAVDVGRLRYPFLPVGWLMQDRYDLLSCIGGVRAPLLIVHGERDSIVPFDMGKRVFAAANQPKEFVALPDAGHNDHSLNGSYEAIDAWIERLRDGRIAAQGDKPSPCDPA